MILHSFCPLVRFCRSNQSVLKWNARVLRTGSSLNGPAHGSEPLSSPVSVETGQNLFFSVGQNSHMESDLSERFSRPTLYQRLIMYTVARSFTRIYVVIRDWLVSFPDDDWYDSCVVMMLPITKCVRNKPIRNEYMYFRMKIGLILAWCYQS